MIESAGFGVLSKRHPKGLAADPPLFADVASMEKTQIGMSDVYGRADVFVLDITGIASVESMCTLKPVLLTITTIRQMTKQGRSDISECAHIVQASFDENNRAIIDHTGLIEAIRESVNWDTRRNFISEYLTSRDSGITSLFRAPISSA